VAFIAINCDYWGILKTGTKVRVVDVLRVAGGSYIWVKFDTNIPPIKPNGISITEIPDTVYNVKKTRNILWLDDHSLKNNWEMIQKFRKNDIKVDTVGTNMEALKMISKKDYDFIITDIGRNNEEMGVKDKNKAGVEFTYAVNDKSKIIICSPTETIKKYQSELLKNGVTHFYSDFDELENYILTNIKKSNPKK
jgi:hypothetical protein